MKEISLDYVNSFMNKNKVYKIDYKKELNEEQYLAATSLEGSYLWVAGAGTGKTRALTFRVAYLIENEIQPENILLLTYTKKAAKEMMDRSTKLLDERCKKINGGTYHGFAANILRKYAKYVGLNNNFTILDSEDTKDVIEVIRDEMKLNKKERMFPNKSILQNIFSIVINKDFTIKETIVNLFPDCFDDIEDIERVYKRFMEFKLENNLVDYDDLLLKFYELLDLNEDIAIKLSNKFKYIMVDEYQDSNIIQLKILKKLCKTHTNIAVVGDPMQSIYKFRGAYFKNIMNFPNDFPGTTIIKFNKNYRCTQQILDLSNSIMENAIEKIYNPLVSDKKNGETPIFLTTSDEYKQSMFIVQEILKEKEKGTPLNEISILIRNAYLTSNLEFNLQRANIPFTKVGGIKFLEKAHIKDVLSLIRIAANIQDTIAWTRLFKMFGGIGAKTANKLAIQISIDKNVYSLVSPKNQKKKFKDSLTNIYNFYNDFCKNSFRIQMDKIIDFYKPIAKKEYEDFDNREQDIDALVELTYDYYTAGEFLDDLMLDEDTTKSDDDKDMITITTIHSSKGLEWDIVFVLTLGEGILPSNKSLDTIEDIEEERRLLYVAFTRARKRLFATVPSIVNRFGNYQEIEPSQFLMENDNTIKYMQHWNIR